jgi:glycosyltransferase involved in cell wall biosynthesis
MSYQVNPTVLFLTTYPPRECGIATFTQDMVRALTRQFGASYDFKVCALEEGFGHQRSYPDEVVATLNTHELKDCADLAERINNDPSVRVVCVQHEFGLFGGEWGDHVLAFLYSVTKPVVINLHTVLPDPSPELRRLMRNMARSAQQLVVMTHRSSDMLQQEYGIAAEQITVVPHGTHLTPWQDPLLLKEKYGLAGKKVLATFGLLSENKGIENALIALRTIKEAVPEVVYLVLGKTHPVVVQHEGEQYREKLHALVDELGLQENVRFVNKYLDLNELLEYLSLTDTYLFVSKDPNQAGSGTFTYAMSCGCPIISTPMPHAQEMLRDDTGILLEDFNQPHQIAKAAIKILSDEALRQHMSNNAYYHTRSAIWQNVAVQYAQLFQQVDDPTGVLRYDLPEVNLRHVRTLTTPVGMIQFAHFGIPDLDSGYTLDDNARVLIAMSMYYHHRREPEALSLLETYLDFVVGCQQTDGSFLNYVDKFQQFTPQNAEVNLDDAAMRAVWSLGTVVRYHKILPGDLVTKAKNALWRALPIIRQVDSPRARAFAIKGLYACHRVEPSAELLAVIDQLALGLLDKFNGVATPAWNWFEDYLTYANSVLSEGMMYAYLATRREEYQRVAYQSFDFLLECLFIKSGQIKVVSNDGWWMKGDICKPGGEQPIDVCYTIMALSLFHQVSQRPEYQEKLLAAFSWYLGNNHLGQIIYNPITGGCFDGLEAGHVNQNQGAESTACYLIARLQMELEHSAAQQPRHTYKIMVGQNYLVTREDPLGRSVA